MSYLLDKKIKRNKFLKYSIFIVLLLFFIYFNSGIFSGFSYVTSTIFRPVLIVGNNIGGKLSSAVSYFRSKESLYLENEDLKSKINEQEARMTNYDLIVSDDLKIKEILGRKEEKANMVLGSILSKPNQSPYDTFIIDVGINDGILVGQRVFADGLVPIGRISETYPKSSKVILFSNPGEKTEVVISGKTIPVVPVVDNTGTLNLPNTETTQSGGEDALMQVVGRGGGNFEMILPRDFALEKGTKAVLPGMTPLVLGTVQTVISDPRDSFEKALLSSPVNIFGLKFIEVEK